MANNVHDDHAPKVARRMYPPLPTSKIHYSKLSVEITPLLKNRSS